MPHKENDSLAQIYKRAHHDGKLVSPIDLSLEDAQALSLEKLKWSNLEERPSKMKLTNSGETVIVSGKWGSQRPYLSGGPLTSKYVLSQIHFHWGCSEHEGSEHTIQGTSYPMEMHVVFFKACYFTQDAALKKEDGVVVVAYLVKLANKTTPSLHWLASQLGKVVQPQSSVGLVPSPLSFLTVPFTEDYLLYYGSLVTTRCSHAIMWLVSRVALGIHVNELNMFRGLLNSRKEAMNKNFKEPSARQDRVIFHINPSAENKHLLLPGIVNLRGHDSYLSGNYCQMPPLSPIQAKRMFNKGDCSEEDDRLTEKSNSSDGIKDITESDPPYLVCDSNMTNLQSTSLKIKKSKYSENLQTSDSSASRPGSPKLDRERALKKSRSQKIREASRRKDLERKRKDEMEEERKLRSKTKVQQRKPHSDDESLPRSLPAQACKSELGLEKSLDVKEVCSALAASNTISTVDEKTKVRPPSRSKLPVRVTTPSNKGLQSSLAKYFQRPDSPKSRNSAVSQRPQTPSAGRWSINRSRHSTIPPIQRPTSKNAGRTQDKYSKF